MDDIGMPRFRKKSALLDICRFSSNREASAYDQFVLLGDSITEFAEDQTKGFALAPAIRSAYIRRLDVVNRGFAGYNTAKCLNILPKLIRPKDEGRIRLLAIWLGANDSVRPGLPGNQALPLPTYQSNLLALSSHPSLAPHAPHIIFLTPPPVDEHQRLPVEGDTLWRTAETTKRYADACVAAAAAAAAGEERRLPVLDVWRLFMREAGWEEGGEKLPGSLLAPRSEVLSELLVDGIHLTPRGYELVYDGLMQLLRDTWPGDCPENLPYVFPSWDDPNAQGEASMRSRPCCFM